MAEKIVTIARFNDSIEANMAKQLLEDFGIRSILTGQNAANIHPGISAVAGVTLQTFESKAKEALLILESGGKEEE